MNRKSNMFRISGRIDTNLVIRFEQFCEQVLAKKKIEDDTTYIHIMSKGGDLGSAAAFISIMKDSSLAFTTIAYHIVHSAAIPIFAAGGLRVAKENRDSFLFHRTKIQNNLVSEKAGLFSEKEAVRFIAESIEIEQSVIESLMIKETYLSAKQAKDINLVNYLIPC